VSAGRVIVLNGTSSVGKTTLGRALQAQLDGIWLLFGIDTLIEALPWRLYGTADGHTINADGTIDTGPVFTDAQRRWRRAVASLARDGADLILDEVLLRGAAEQAEWREALRGLDVTWIAVRCDVEVAAAREAARGNRSVGMARAQATAVHEGVQYDLEVDTTSSSPDDLAAQIVRQLG
jgi:chloramphenicol 3-O phosphotransferase